MAAPQEINNRLLPERSGLKFLFTDGEGIKVVALPFYQNISVKESKKARYAKYSPFSRTSNLYTYTGADSRQIKVDFVMTLPHIREAHPEVGRASYLTHETDTFSEQQKFFNSPATGSSNKFGNFAGTAQELEEEFILGGAKGQQLGGDGNAARKKAIDAIAYWVNIVRASVLNNVHDPVWGPPIVRLTHGILYRDVPCIVTGYSIDYPPRAGFDLKTLLPREIKISLTMEELRMGNFEEFKVYSARDTSDNIAGWEAVISAPGTTDPQPITQGGV